MIDPRTPVIVGVGQMLGSGEAGEPLDLVVAAIDRALADTGGRRALPLDTVALTKIGTQRYTNAPGAAAERLGRPDARTVQANHGGHTAQVVLAHLAAAIAHGSSDVAVLAGGELGSAIRSGRLRADIGTPAGDEEDATGADAAPGLAIGDDLYQWVCHPEEAALGIADPVTMYPVMDTALGAALGRTRDEHRREIGELWARMSRVAASNPFAVDRRGYSAEEVTTPSERNRWVGHPYTKLMNSDQFVDQSAAVVLCSVAAAERLGIARDRWVFPWAAVTAHEPVPSERRHLHESRALAAAAHVLEQLAGRPARDAELVDLYACFPFAVQTQAIALGIDLGRELTLTGGMRFAGGPWNNYGTHMIANVVARLREEPASFAVASTNGGLATRFCVGAYSGRPAPDGFRAPPAPIADPGPRRRLETRPTGRGRIEGCTVVHRRHDEPIRAVAACILADGSRAWAALEHDDDIRDVLALDPVGSEVVFTAGGARLAG